MSRQAEPVVVFWSPIKMRHLVLFRQDCELAVLSDGCVSFADTKGRKTFIKRETIINYKVQAESVKLTCADHKTYKFYFQTKAIAQQWLEAMNKNWFDGDGRSHRASVGSIDFWFEFVCVLPATGSQTCNYICMNLTVK